MSLTSTWKGGTINVSIEVVDGHNSDYRFACYLFKDQQVVEKQLYQTGQNFTFEVGAAGKYMCRCFARDKNQETFSRYSEIVTVFE